jgi:hypothetical protein
MYISTGEGHDGSARTFFNDVWRLHVSTRTWASMNPASAAGGSAPPARYGAASGVITFPDGAAALAIATGFNREVRFNDVWLYDIQGNTWVSPTVEGKAPSPRCLAASMRKFRLWTLSQLGAMVRRLQHTNYCCSRRCHVEAAAILSAARELCMHERARAFPWKRDSSCGRNI